LLSRQLWIFLVIRWFPYVHANPSLPNSPTRWMMRCSAALRAGLTHSPPSHIKNNGPKVLGLDRQTNSAIDRGSIKSN
jgi:hypothetical protein